LVLALSADDFIPPFFLCCTKNTECVQAAKTIKHKMILLIKKLVEKFPAPLSRWANLVPFRFRLGEAYTRAQSDILKSLELDSIRQKSIIFEKVHAIFSYSFRHNAFYRGFCSSKGFHPEQLRSFDDIQKIPIICKADFQKSELRYRSLHQRGALLLNTGGTSGEPLEFYIDRHAFAREWAHMHRIWRQLCYKPSHLKLTFRGKNLGDKMVRYNPVHNEYLVNAYANLSDVSDAIYNVASKRPISFLHGYPSSVYRFAEFCGREKKNLANLLNRSLKGVFFASEFPAPAYRDEIKKIFPVPTISWYGHSEMAVLAYERHQAFVYEPFHTYGYSEAVPTEEGSSYRLIGTSYHNTVSPFIRYDTGDLVRPDFRDGLLQSFEIAEGRIGDFITDAKGNQISLTALIFGRHHPIFSKARFMQVCQRKPGEATILLNLRNGLSEADIDWNREFDASSLFMNLTYRMIPEPVQTATGKIPLLVKPDQLYRVLQYETDNPAV
jgi:phenylacetate-CoA ligase